MMLTALSSGVLAQEGPLLPSQMPAGLNARSLTPSQRQAVKMLTPSQRKAVEDALAETGGRVTPDIIEMLKKSPEEALEDKSVIEEKGGGLKEYRIEKHPEEREEKEGGYEKEEGIAQKERGFIKSKQRFGLDFFMPARKRILSIEKKIAAGGVLQVIDRDALSGFVGPLDIVSSYVDITIPPDYVLNPGDRAIIHYWGDSIELTTVSLSLDKEGAVSIPRVGHFVARGMTIVQFQDAVRKKLKRSFRGETNLIVTLDKLRSIQIFITGGVFRPGSYAVSAVTTLFNALYACGGPADFGSLRDIKLFRNNKTIRIDFYDYLLKGDNRSDLRLKPGDTIFVSKVVKLASVEGEVNRPCIYELKKHERLRDLIHLANGVKPTGMLQSIQIKSVRPNKEKIIIDVDMSKDVPASNPELFSGDSVKVSSILPEIINMVTLEGKVERPGEYELKENMRVSDFFSDINRPLGEAHLKRADVIRLNQDDKTTTLIPIDLKRALAKDLIHDIELAPMDRVVVYSKWDVKFLPERMVKISGAVQRSGDYERSEKMRMSDLLVKAGGVLPNVYLERADLLRYDFEKETYANIRVNIRKVLAGDKSEDLELQDRDHLRVYSLKEKEFVPPHEISVFGAVQRPGKYIRFEGMRVDDILIAAGGLLPGTIQEVDIAKARSEGQTEIIRVNLELLRSGDESQNILLEDEDVVTVRKKSEFYEKPRWVTVSGEVKYPGTYALYGKEDRMNDVLQRAGGLTRFAYPKGTVLSRMGEHVRSSEMSKDLILVNTQVEELNELQYKQALARSSWLWRKEKGAGAEPQLFEANAGTVVVGEDEPAEAAAIAMAPGIASATGQTVEGFIGAFESSPAVVSKARKFKDSDLLPPDRVRVIIRMEDILKDKGGRHDIILMAGDTIHIPRVAATVSVIGAVMRPTWISYMGYKKGEYFIDRAGGYGEDADIDRTLIVRVDGSLERMDELSIVEAGDIIYVPPKVLALEIVPKIDKIIEAVKFGLVTASSVAVFIVLVSLF